jgi:NAD(P)-dependent dehydrogenase (short-subunit alcohol dehydrogenase family)
MSKKLKIVITGVSRGLGRALAFEFARAGNMVLGCARTEQAIEQLRRQLGPPHDFSVVDVADDAAVKQWAKRLLEAYGPPDLLLNNAAIINRLAPLWKISADEFGRLVDINIKGVVNVIRHFVPAMVERRAGVIVNLSSGWGRSTDANVAPYCASKYAIEGLTQAFAQELPDGMAAIALNPGIINTDMLQQCFGENALQYPTAEQWAKKAAPFLLKLNRNNNGQSLTAPQ